MTTPVRTISKVSDARLGGWLPHNREHTALWIQKLRRKVEASPQPLIEPIAVLRQMVYGDPVLYANVQGMFAEAHFLESSTPLGWQPEPLNFEDFLALLNAIMCTAPEAYQSKTNETQGAAGLIGFPINALLDWPMGTSFGYDVFSNALVNQQFKKILQYWSVFLGTEASRYVLTQDDLASDALAWLNPTVQAEMVNAAQTAFGPAPNPITKDATFAQVFNCNPADPYYGFRSWDDFFTRTFREGVRPVSGIGDDSIIVNACESGPLAITRNVALSDAFWLKDQRYSLENMLNWDDYTPQFAGGEGATVYQAFLSALSYHRWHSPVSGTIRKAYVVNGAYYLENLQQGFFDPQGADPIAPNNSQAFLTAVATRALIFIEADNPDIGLMCVMPVGMAEVSSCDITVQPGQHVEKGDELGMFHFGGSTHCLIFRPGVNLAFTAYEPSGLSAGNVRVNAKLAVVSPASRD